MSGTGSIVFDIRLPPDPLLGKKDSRMSETTAREVMSLIWEMSDYSWSTASEMYTRVCTLIGVEVTASDRKHIELYWGGTSYRSKKLLYFFEWLELKGYYR